MTRPNPPGSSDEERTGEEGLSHERGIVDIKSEARAVKSDAKERRGIMKKILEGAQQHVKVNEKLEKKLDKQGFFSRIFGKHSKITMLITAVANKLGIGKKEDIKFEEFQKEIGTDDIETFIVSHRALGYGRHKQNSKESIEAALNGGEQQLEIDLRTYKGEVYLSHDSIENESDPSKNHLSLKEALAIFANHDNQDIAIFFDIKDPEVLDHLDKLIKEEDKKHETQEGYMPIADKHFVMSFDHKIIAKAYEKNQDRPLMFNFIPTAILNESKKEFQNYQREDIESICGAVDMVAGTHLKDDLETTDIFLHGRELKPKGQSPKIENVVHIVEEMPNIKIGNPPKDIMKVAKYVCIPAALATPSLVSKIKAKGPKVAVWGAEGKHIQKAIAVSHADLVISDKPNVIENNQNKR